MPRDAVRLLATIGACSVFALALSSGADAVEVNTHVNIPHINVPKPHITVPTVNLRHHRQSTGTNTLTNEKLNATTVNTPAVGPSNGGGAAEGKVIIESVGGSATPSGVQQQNAAAAAAAAAAIAGASSGAPGRPNTSPPGTWNPSLANTHDGVIGPVEANPLPKLIPPPYGSAAYVNYLTGGGENSAYAKDMEAFQAAVAVCEVNGGGACAAARSGLRDFNAYMNYLLGLLASALNPDTANTGESWTPQEIADIEAAITACLNSPSTCAATITNLNAELASLGVPTVFVVTFGAYAGASWQVLYTPAQIDSGGLYGPFEETYAPLIIRCHLYWPRI